MDFALSSEQEMMRESLMRALEESAGLEGARKAALPGAEGASQAWSTLIGLGAAGVLVPEAMGGMGLSCVEAMLVAEASGRHVANTPFLASSVMATLALRLAGSASQQATWLPRMARGSSHLGVAFAEAAEGSRDGAGVNCDEGRLSGRALFVIGGADAEAYLVADRERTIHLVHRDSPGLHYGALNSIDRTTALGRLDLQDAPGEPLCSNTEGSLLARAIAAGRVMLAAEVIGAADHMLAAAVDYAKVRQQFGRPIGSFQAVKHLLADLVAELEPARALVWYAAYLQDSDPERAIEVAALAKSHACEVGSRVARGAIEVHGAMGVTDLLGLHYWFKRIGLARQLLGGPAALRREVGARRMRDQPVPAHPGS